MNMDARPFAAVVLTRSGKMLAHCATGRYAQNPRLQLGPLCDLLTTMQDVAGHPLEGYVELHGVGIVLLEGYRVVIAVLCDPKIGIETARLVGMQALNVFGKLYHKQAEELDLAHAAEASAAAESYTVHSASANAAGSSSNDQIGLPAFAAFRQTFLQPLLLRAPPCELWLNPLTDVSSSAARSSALRAFLVNPAPLRTQQSVLLASAVRNDRPLAACAGPHIPSMWADVLTHCQLALQDQSSQRPAASDKQNRRARLSLLAFPELAHAGWCVHVVLRAVRVIPAGACLVVCFEAPLPPLPPSPWRTAPPTHSFGSAEAAEAAGSPSSSRSTTCAALVLDDTLVPQELRLALNQSARLISGAFPAAVASLPDLGAAAALAAAADEDEGPLPLPPLEEDGTAHAPATPVRSGHPPTRMPAPATPLQLDIESPRAADAQATPSASLMASLPEGALGAPPLALHPATRRELYAAPDDD